MLSKVFSIFLYINIIGSLLVGLLLLLRHILRPNYQTILWKIFILSLIIPLGLGPEKIDLPEGAIEAYSEEFKEVEIENPRDFQPLVPRPVAKKVINFSFLPRLWLLGVLIIGGLVIFLDFLSTGEEKQLEALNTRSLLEVLEGAREDLKIARKISLKSGEGFKSPYIKGILRPYIYLPEGLVTSLDPSYIDYIIYHELSHYKRGDLIWNKLQLLGGILHWYNPLILYGLGRAREDHELACDYFVISKLGQDHRLEYGKSLIEVSRLNLLRSKASRRMFTTAYLRDSSQIKRRIIMIRDFKKASKLKKSLFILALVLLLTLGAKKLKGFTRSHRPVEKISSLVEEKDKRPIVKLESQDYDFSGLTYMLSETEKKEDLEEAIIKFLGQAREELGDLGYYYNYIDLNGDGEEEIFVYLTGMMVSGSGGSTGLILNKDYDYISHMTLVNTPVVALESKSNGYRDLLMEVSGGGIEKSYFSVMEFDGTSYPLNPSMAPEFISRDQVEGLGLIGDEISPDTRIEL